MPHLLLISWFLTHTVKCILIMHQYGPQEPNKCNKCGINVNFLKEGFNAFDGFVRLCTADDMFHWL